MKMFLRLSVFVFLGIVFLFVGGTADGQNRSLSSLEVLGDWEATYKVGDVVAATFLATIDGDPASGVQLTITHSAGIGNIAISNGGITNALGDGNSNGYNTIGGVCHYHFGGVCRYHCRLEG